MTLEKFAERYKLRIRKDSCDDPIIPGRVKGAKRLEDNHHVWQNGNQLLVYLNFPTSGRWNSARKRLIAAGAYPSAIGDMDGHLVFDPENESLVKLVLKLAKIRVKRQLTEEQKAAMKERFAKVKTDVPTPVV